MTKSAWAQVITLQPAKGTPTLSDEALLVACATGDTAALALLFERYSHPVHRFISRMVGPPSIDVEDLAQATFIEVWRSAARYSARSSGRVWIFGIAHNVARTALRAQRRRFGALQRLAVLPAADPPSLDAQVSERELVDRLAGALRGLSEGQRAAFLLCELEELTGAEASKVLDARPGTVGRWLHEAKQRLKAALQEEKR